MHGVILIFEVPCIPLRANLENCSKPWSGSRSAMLIFVAGFLAAAMTFQQFFVRTRLDRMCRTIGGDG